MVGRPIIRSTAKVGDMEVKVKCCARKCFIFLSVFCCDDKVVLHCTIIMADQVVVISTLPVDLFRI